MPSYFTQTPSYRYAPFLPPSLLHRLLPLSVRPSLTFFSLPYFILSLTFSPWLNAQPSRQGDVCTRGEKPGWVRFLCYLLAPHAGLTPGEDYVIVMKIRVNVSFLLFYVWIAENHSSKHFFSLFFLPRIGFSKVERFPFFFFFLFSSVCHIVECSGSSVLQVSSFLAFFLSFCFHSRGCNEVTFFFFLYSQFRFFSRVSNEVVDFFSYFFSCRFSIRGHNKVVFPSAGEHPAAMQTNKGSPPCKDWFALVLAGVVVRIQWRGRLQGT